MPTINMTFTYIVASPGKQPQRQKLFFPFWRQINWGSDCDQPLITQLVGELEVEPRRVGLQSPCSSQNVVLPPSSPEEREGNFYSI